MNQTVGQASVDLMSKPAEKQGAVETQQEMLKSYVDQLIIAAREGEKRFSKLRPFYVCVQTRRERLLENVIRNQFYPRQSRPYPDYDLALYYYDPRDESLSFVWCIPDRQTVEYLITNETDLPKEQLQLLSFCKAFKEGRLI